MPDNPNTASPVRSAKPEYFERAMVWLEGEAKTPDHHASVVLAHIASLEASQPKPQSDEGLREALQSVRGTLGYLVTQAKLNHPGFSMVAKQNAEVAIHKADAALSRQAPVPTPDSEDLAVRIAELARSMRDKPYEDLAAAIEPMLAMPAPVPTSGAVEVAQEIDDCVVSLETMKVNPIANAKYILMPACKPHVWQMRMVAEAYLNLLRLTPPAADGKLREALEELLEASKLDRIERLAHGMPGDRITSRLAEAESVAYRTLAQPASGGADNA